MKQGHDVIVIGAGVIGTAVAYLLAREGINVGLIDRGNAASGTSGATMGNLSLHNRLPGPTMDLALASYSLYREWSETLPSDFEFEIVSSLMLIGDDHALDWARERVTIQREAGLNVEFIDARRLAEVDDTVAGDIPGAVYCPPSARLNPFLLCNTLAQSAERLGARFYRHTEVTDVLVAHGAIAGVAAGKKTIGCDLVVNAAGVDSGCIARMAGAHIPIVGNRGVLAVTERFKDPGIRVKGECTEGGLKDTPQDALDARYDVHLVFSQTQSGNCLIGRSGEPLHECSAKGIAEAAFTILRRAQRFIPGISRIPLIRVFHGVRPYSPDSLPILGEMTSPRRLFAACGFGDKGFALGAAGAQLVVDAIINRGLEIEEIFSPARFSAAGR